MAKGGDTGESMAETVLVAVTEAVTEAETEAGAQAWSTFVVPWTEARKAAGGW